ncbi:MAG: gamma-glutamyltransferase [Vicinamibacterales bacterium]
MLLTALLAATAVPLLHAQPADDVARIAGSGRKVAIIGIENGYAIGTDVKRVREFWERGGRYLSLAHNGHNQLADSNTGEAAGTAPNGGISPLGRRVLAEMNRLGIMVDVSHPSRAAILQATELSKAPVIASHSGVRALSNHSRNLDDEPLRAIQRTGGGVQIDHVGIASDFDGGGGIDGWNSAAETFNGRDDMTRWMAAVATGTALIAGTLAAPISGAREPVRTRSVMVIAQAPAEQAGLDVLRKGGNAIDAAVAIGFALNAVYPYAGALGGGGFMLIRLASGHTTFIDFREKAPAAASRTMYLDAAGEATRGSVEGWTSSGVPGMVRGFELARAKYGKLSWADDLAPAIALASNGFEVSYALAEQLKTSRSLARDPESTRIWLKGGAFYEAGDRLVLPELASTLTRIARNGPDEFYRGETAQHFAAAMKAHGGYVTLEDLHAYEAVERTPLTGRYRSYQIITSPPPSAGGIGLLQMLAMLETTGYEKSGFGSAASIHLQAEVMRRSFADRNSYLGDPDFVRNPVEALLDPAYVARRRASIDHDRATSSRSLGPGLPDTRDRGETTHFSVVDAEGNAVAVTYTLNGGFGNGITVPGLGFLLNNEMDDFTSKPGAPNMFGLVQGEPNAIAPGKRPLSSMTPTMVLRDGELFMILGGPGGSRIPTAILQVMLNIMDFGMGAQEAVDAPRFHHQWLPDAITVERGFSPDTLALLRGRGHDVRNESGPVAAVVEVILKDDGWLQGAADGRRWGRAAGY